MAQLGLKHFDGGGLVGGLGSALGMTNNFTASNGITNQDLTNQLANANQGVSNAQSFYNQMQPGVAQGLSTQNALAAQLQGLANGTGANPAQAQLQQATQANTANTAALMAGQRGSSQNAGLIARQAGQQGAANQQTAAGQAATLGAQQQIAAMNNLQNLASTQVSQGGQALTGENQAAQGVYGISEGAAGTANNTNAQTAAQNTASNNGLLGGAVSGISSALGGLFANGGAVPMLADGGTLGSQDTSSGGSWVGNWLNNTPSSVPAPQQNTSPSSSGGKSLGSGLGSVAMLAMAADGGRIRQFANKGGAVEAETPSEKAVEPTKNNYANDKIPAMLSEYEVVMDHETLNDPGPIGQMARAVAAHIEERNKRRQS